MKRIAVALFAALSWVAFAQPTIEEIQANYCLDLPNSAACVVITPPPTDSDGDGIPDSDDECPNDPTNTCNDPVDPPPVGDIGSVMLPPDMTPTILAGETVTWSGVVIENDVVVEGDLIIQDGSDVTLRCLYVKNGGSVTFGSASQPAQNINLVSVGELDLVKDPFQWCPGININGHIAIYGADTGLNPVYANPVTGEEMSTPHWEDEVITLADGTEVSLKAELQARGLPTEINLTRGVKFSGGHFAILRDGTWHIDGLELDNVGRTTTAVPNDTQYLEDGSLHIGTNMRGRYALHWHHNKANDPTQIARNIVVRGGEKWGVTVHGTDDVAIEDSITWKAPGAGFNIEGTSVDNAVLRRVMAIRSTGVSSAGEFSGSHGGQRENHKTGPLALVIDGGIMGDGFWFEHGLGWCVESSAAIYNAQNGFFGSGYWRKPEGEDRAKNRDHCFDNFLTWRNKTGLWLTWDQGVSQWPYVRRTYNLYSYHDDSAIEAYHTANIDFTGVAHGNPELRPNRLDDTQFAPRGINISNISYENGGHTVNMDVSGWWFALALPSNCSAPIGFTDAEKAVVAPVTVTGRYFLNHANITYNQVQNNQECESFVNITTEDFPYPVDFTHDEENAVFVTDGVLFINESRRGKNGAHTLNYNGQSFQVPEQYRVD